MKMNLLLLLTILGAVSSTPISQNLYIDFLDFMPAMHLDEVLNIYMKHLETDASFRAAIQYFSTDEWKDLVRAFISRPEVQEIFSIFQKYDLDLYGNFNNLLSKQQNESNIILGSKRASLKLYMEDLKGVINCEEIRNMIKFKTQNSNEFRKFYDAITGGKMKELILKATATKEFDAMREKLEEMDVPVRKILDRILSMFQKID